VCVCVCLFVCACVCVILTCFERAAQTRAAQTRSAQTRRRLWRAAQAWRRRQRLLVALVSSRLITQRATHASYFLSTRLTPLDSLNPLDGLIPLDGPARQHRRRPTTTCRRSRQHLDLFSISTSTTTCLRSLQQSSRQHSCHQPRLQAHYPPPTPPPTLPPRQGPVPCALYPVPCTPPTPPPRLLQGLTHAHQQSLRGVRRVQWR